VKTHGRSKVSRVFAGQPVVRFMDAQADRPRNIGQVINPQIESSQSTDR